MPKKQRPSDPTKANTVAIVTAIITAVAAIIVAYIQFGPPSARNPVAPSRRDVSARITALETGAPVVGARVTLMSGGVFQTKFTDDEGVIVFSVPAELRRARIHVRADRFRTFDRIVAIVDDDFEDIRLDAIESSDHVSPPPPLPKAFAVDIPFAGPFAFGKSSDGFRVLITEPAAVRVKGSAVDVTDLRLAGTIDSVVGAPFPFDSHIVFGRRDHLLSRTSSVGDWGALVNMSNEARSHKGIHAASSANWVGSAAPVTFWRYIEEVGVTPPEVKLVKLNEIKVPADGLYVQIFLWSAAGAESEEKRADIRDLALHVGGKRR